MIYRVLWLPGAESELAAIWVASSRRNDVTQAAAELDRRLALNGPDEGESRPDDMRITFVWPLAIVFQVDESTKTIRVGQVWEFE